MKAYEEFKNHEHNFNVLFLATVSVIIAIFLGAIAITLRILETQNLWIVIFIILIITPVAIYLTAEGNTEFKTAFYKTWQDIIRGNLDQKKIFNSFAKKYGIDNYKIKPYDIEADGRWNFNADTPYMHTLVHQRNLLLNDLADEYSKDCAIIDKKIIQLEKEHSNKRSDLVTIEALKENALALKKLAKTAAEKYYYREQYDKRTIEKLTIEKEVHDALCDWNVAKRERERMNKTYSITVEQVNKIYNERYAKYTERAIKKLNKIHGLKYKIADMSEIERGV